MKTTIKILPLLAALILAGCGTPKAWYRPDTTADQARMDEAQCRILANTSVSRQQVFVPGPGAGWAMLGQGIGQDDERKQLTRDCMLAKGYQWLPVNQATNPGTK